MTGESDELKKDTYATCMTRKEEKLSEISMQGGGKKGPHDAPSPVLLSGTQVSTGEGWFVTIMVGKQSCVGRIMGTLEQEIEATPLQMKLEQIGSDIGKLGMYSALLTVHILFIRYFIEAMLDRNFHFNERASDYLKVWLDYFIIGVTIVVVAVPEGLPLAVMISLAYSVKKMLIDQNFVKRLSSCEIMGGANNICSDKTGTLTMNKMTVTDIWSGKKITLPQPKNKDDPIFYNYNDHFNNNKAPELLTQAICCNTSGRVGDATATEMAMLELMGRLQIDYEDIRKKYLPENMIRFQFTSKRKRMSTILQDVTDTETGYDKRVHLKGAAEIVLASCTHYLNEDGQKQELQDHMKQHMMQVITDYATMSLRTICFGYKDLKPGEGGPTHEEMDEDQVIHTVEKTGFTCIGIIGIKDIIRPEVPGAVAQCQKAQIMVRMVTGDNIVTATAIAKECGILKGNQDQKPDSVMEGPAFAERIGGLVCLTCNRDSPCDCEPRKIVEGVKNKDEFKVMWKNLRVLARSRPDDKYLLVTALRQYGDVVAVTGDGTNDAPALKKADVGFAMGITGTDVAKHAADIIVMDDNFASIVKAAMWGRNIYDNIRRFLQFQLSVNVVALISAFFGAVITEESPLQPIQLLWVNMIMDSLASLALATEPPKLTLLERPPQGRDEYIISRKMVKHILTMSIWQCIVTFGILFGGESFIPEGRTALDGV